MAASNCVGDLPAVDFGQIASDHHLAGAVITAKLLDIHGDEKFILQDKNPQSVKQRGHRQRLLEAHGVMIAIWQAVI